MIISSNIRTSSYKLQTYRRIEIKLSDIIDRIDTFISPSPVSVYAVMLLLMRGRRVDVRRVRIGQDSRRQRMSDLRGEYARRQVQTRTATVLGIRLRGGTRRMQQRYRGTEIDRGYRYIIAGR